MTIMIISLTISIMTSRRIQTNTFHIKNTTESAFEGGAFVCSVRPEIRLVTIYITFYLETFHYLLLLFVRIEKTF